MSPQSSSAIGVVIPAISSELFFYDLWLVTNVVKASYGAKLSSHEKLQDLACEKMKWGWTLADKLKPHEIGQMCGIWFEPLEEWNSLHVK